MQFKRLNSASLIIISFLLVCLTLNQSDNSTDIVSTSIKDPIQKKFYRKTYNMIAEVNVPIQIQQPFQIQPVYLHNFSINNNSSANCWFQSSQIKRKKAQYLSFKKQELGKFDQWDIEILDATYLYKSQTLIGLFTNGSIFQAPLSSNLSQKFQKNQIKKIYTYAQNNTNQIWQLSQYSLFSSNSALYLLKQQTLYKINLNQQALQWNIVKLENGLFVKRAINYYGVLYILKFNQISKVQQDSMDEGILAYDAPSVQFIDMAISGQFIYILDRYVGIIVAKKSDNQYSIKKIYPIDRLENAMRINVFQDTILITYLIHHKNFVAQIFILQEQLILNKFYYRYDRLSNIIMFNKYAIGYSLNQMIVFQHSINRNIPINMKSSQFLSRTLYNKVVDIIQIGNNTMGFILILNRKVFVQTLGQFFPESNSKSLLHKTLKCTFQKVGNFSIETFFQGICQNDSYSSKSTYCNQAITFSIQVHSEKIRNDEESDSTHLALIFLWGILLVLLIGVILVYRRRVLQRAQKLIEQQKRRTNSEMISMQKESKNQEQIR